MSDPLPASLHAEHDPQADAAYVRLRAGVYHATRRLDSSRLLDVAAGGTVLGVELLNVSDGVDLIGVPQARDVAAALRRAGIRVLQPAI